MKIFVVDAFTDKLFSGNQAAVCILDKWVSDDTMLDIAVENNFSETAFAVKQKNNTYDLRWFTPGGEIDLCGHATLATAFVIHHFIDSTGNTIVFNTLSGELYTKVERNTVTMDFPAYKLREVPVITLMEKVCGKRPVEAYLDRDLLLVFDSEDDVRNMKPDLQAAKELDGLALIVTAKGKDYDCISRVFAPKMNVEEDPVTGSAHCMIAPYWLNKLKVDHIAACQASKRSGMIMCEMKADRVILKGQAVLYSSGKIFM